MILSTYFASLDATNNYDKSADVISSAMMAWDLLLMAASSSTDGAYSVITLAIWPSNFFFSFYLSLLIVLELRASIYWALFSAEARYLCF